MPLGYIKLFAAIDKLLQGKIDRIRLALQSADLQCLLQQIVIDVEIGRHGRPLFTQGSLVAMCIDLCAPTHHLAVFSSRQGMPSEK